MKCICAPAFRFGMVWAMSKGSGAVGRWREILNRQTSSGLSVAAFCRRSRTPQATFYGWRRVRVDRGLRRRHAFRRQRIGTPLCSIYELADRFRCSCCFSMGPGELGIARSVGGYGCYASFRARHVTWIGRLGPQLIRGSSCGDAARSGVKRSDLASDQRTAYIQAADSDSSSRISA